MTVGLETAIDDAGWPTNSSKHIILVGDAPNKPTSGPTIDYIVKKANQVVGNDQQTARSPS